MGQKMPKMPFLVKVLRRAHQNVLERCNMSNKIDSSMAELKNCTLALKKIEWFEIFSSDEFSKINKVVIFNDNWLLVDLHVLVKHRVQYSKQHTNPKLQNYIDDFRNELKKVHKRFFKNEHLCHHMNDNLALKPGLKIIMVDYLPDQCYDKDLDGFDVRYCPGHEGVHEFSLVDVRARKGRERLDAMIPK